MRGTHDVIAFHALRPGIIPAYARNTCRNDTRGCCTWDHPRVCGEHGTTLGSKRLKRGSSPRMRGTPEKDMEPYQTGGIIPAYAGNTFRRRRVRVQGGDHPRVCGEHKRLPRTHTTRPGSSPRMRGTLQRSLDMWYFIGIIPAYAGNTQSNTMRGASVWDHPRVCGEHGDNNEESIEDLGSSPRMRGTPYRQPVLAHGAGIIPAYAGNTRLQRYQHERCRDHPRVCGEHCEGLFVASGDVGSSPRMRGAPARYCASRSNAGIIPAYAGNTSTTRARRCLPRDHPRVCGEHQSGAPIQFVGLGIIPAYAGNTSFSEFYNTVDRDHPRVCGEHLMMSSSVSAISGSSPRMRGTLSVR